MEISEDCASGKFPHSDQVNITFTHRRVGVAALFNISFNASANELVIVYPSGIR